MKKVGIFVGSLRKGSFSRQVAKELASLFPSDLEAEFIDLSQLEMYNQDFDDEGKVPASWQTFREKVAKLDAFLFVTPEYNRSVPAVLKNALDVGSRPYGHSVWDKKPGAVVSVSPGKLSAFGANHHLRQSLVFLNVPTMQQPEAYIGNVNEILDENGKVKDEGTKGFFQEIVNAFASWIALTSQK